MKQIYLTFLTIFLAFTTIGESKKLVIDFEVPAIIKAVQRTAYASIEKDDNGNNILVVDVPKGEVSNATVSIPLDLKALGATGNNLIVEANVKIDDITKPAKHYWGAKMTIPINSKLSGKSWPALLREEQVNNQLRYGTHKWSNTQSSVYIPEDIEQAYLRLGIENSDGKISFRNIVLSVGSSNRKSILAQDDSNIKKARYTQDFPRQRGVMSAGTFEKSKPISEQDFADLASWGANSFRYQMNFKEPAKSESWEAYTRKMFAKHLKDLPRILDLGKKYNISIVIDVHAFGSTRRNFLGTQKGRDMLVEFWKEIVSKHKGHPAIWGYDLINEASSAYIPVGNPSLEEQYENLIKTIRKIDPVTPIIVGTDGKGTVKNLQYLPVYDYDNIIYSFHFYIPMEVTHQTKSDQKNYIGYPSKGFNKEYLRKTLEDYAVNVQKKSNGRIYIGEFGCIRWAPGADQYIKDCIELFEEYGWDWAYHAFREWDGWSVEHSSNPSDNEIHEMTPAKKALLDGFKHNKQQSKQ